MHAMQGPRAAITADGKAPVNQKGLAAKLDQVRAMQAQLGQGPDVDDQLAQEASVFLSAPHFARLREFLFDASYRQRPPVQGDIQASAMSLAAFQGRCGLMDLVFALAHHHEQKMENEK
jgi:hypothetical protein